jgi:hypothetical protein
MNEQTKLANKRQWKTEADARKAARHYFANIEVLVIHSPHKDNKLGDYWVEEAERSTFVRSWEIVLYQGVGCRA